MSVKVCVAFVLKPMTIYLLVDFTYFAQHFHGFCFFDFFIKDFKLPMARLEIK